ncbi:MAG: hypothetical protein PHX34_05345 [Candidatus Shapirobacteria bacterium]|nr:hypothetical protein [Candidatus Shapirobacteria bacterium]
MAWLRFSEKSKLVLVLFFAFLVFTYKLGDIPLGVYSDETVVGYDAYSILYNFRDHWGKFLPVYFKFFGSYTPGLFVYLQTIPIKLLGLDSFSVRILSVLSMLSIAVAIFVFWKKSEVYKKSYLPLLSVFLFVISPWTVFNARIGYETTFAFALISWGILLYKNPLLSFSLISLSTYAGHSQRYLAPLVMGLIFFIFYFKKVPFKKILRPLIISVIIQIPNLILLFTPSFWVKNSSFSSNFWSQYISYFLPSNLFNGQDFDLQRSIPELSVFYFWMFIPWIAGFYAIYKNWKKPIYKYLFFLALISPIPAALANTNYSTQRSLLLLLPYILIISLGMDKILVKIKSKTFILFLFLVFLYSLILLWRSYFVLLPAERNRAWNFGYEKLADFVVANSDKKFVIDNSRSVAYIELLFFLKYNPIDFQRENNLFGNDYYRNISFSGNVNFSNIETRPIDWKTDVYKEEIMVGDVLSISDDQVREHCLDRVFEIDDLNGKVLLVGYKTNPEIKLRELEK